MKQKSSLKVKLMEVAPRDGLQNEKLFIDTNNKIGFIEGLVASGIKRIEVTAFVNPKWIPSLADQCEVAKFVKKKKGVSYAALVPNMKGYERALSSSIDEVSFVLAASDTHNQKNINATTSIAYSRYTEVANRANEDKLPFRVYISCAFGCPYEGQVDVAEVVRLSKVFEKMGAYEICLGDTIGAANPKQVKDVVQSVIKEVPLTKIALHLHDTQGMALANIYSALEQGVRSFDSAAGGLGGCPYAPGASGNVATEDLVNMLTSLGVDTDVDLARLCNVSLKMEKLLRRHLPSKVLAVHRASVDEKTSSK